MPPVFSSPDLIVLDCGASRTALGVFNLKGGRLQCAHVAVEQFSATTSGENFWLENTTTSLRALNAGGNWSGPAVLVLPAHLTLTKQIKTPRVEPAKREKIIHFEAEQAIPHALTEVVWDWLISGQWGAEEQIMLIATKGEVLHQLYAAAQATGFTPRRILPSSLATLAGYRLAHSVRTQPALILNLGARSTTILQVEDTSFMVRTVAIGRGAITTEPSAEEIEILATRLVQEVTRTVMHFGRHSGMASPLRVFLTGGGAALTGLGEALAAKLKLPVERFDVLGAVDISVGSIPTSTLTDLIGAAAIALLPSQPAINLLPSRLRQDADLRRRRPWLLSAAVLAVVALMPPLIYYRQVTATAQAKTAAMEKVMAPLRAREVRNRTNLAELDQLKARIILLQSVHDRRAGWLQFFSGLQEQLVRVEDVWLERLQIISPAEGVPQKLVVSGRMLDKTNPLAKVSPEALARVQDLLAGIADLPAVSAVEGERFDNSQPGILRLDFVIVADPTHPL